MAGGKFTDKQLDQIAKHATKGIIAKLDGNTVEAGAQMRRAQMVANTARNSNQQGGRRG
jgi:hypothetical protein